MFQHCQAGCRALAVKAEAGAFAGIFVAFAAIVAAIGTGAASIKKQTKIPETPQSFLKNFNALCCTTYTNSTDAINDSGACLSVFGHGKSTCFFIQDSLRRAIQKQDTAAIEETVAPEFKS